MNNTGRIVLLAALALLLMGLVIWLGIEYSDESRTLLRTLLRAL